MRWITHVAVSFLMIKVFEITLLVDLSSSNLFWVVMPLYSVIADFDSLVGIKHRTFTHAIYSPIVASLPLLAFGDLFFVAIVSYSSHLFADLMTTRGVPLLYPFKETSFNFLPPAWRVKTGSNAEVVFLLAVVLLTASFSLAESTKEVDKIFSYRRSADVWVDVSFYENGVLKSYENDKVVWDDGKSKFGIVHNGKLKIVSKDQIKELKIKRVEEVERKEKLLKVSVKSLRFIDELVVAYRINFEWVDFLGTGKDLFYSLYDGSNANEKVWIRIVE